MNTVYMYGPLVLLVIAVVVLVWKWWSGRNDLASSHYCEEWELDYMLHITFMDEKRFSVHVDDAADAQVMLNRFAFGGVDKAYLTENGVDIAFMNSNGLLVRNMSYESFR